MITATQLTIDSRNGTYTVHIGAGLTGDLPRLLEEASLPARRVIVSSPRIWRLHGRALTGVAPRPGAVLFPDGERYKTLQSVTRIWDALVRGAADRATTVIAFGGGVVGDVAGFAAAAYLRGVPVVQVPTTLLAQVDSAIGGKVGVNHPQGKNLIGAFHAPALVVADPLLLATLPRREFRSGLYEVVKYGVIASRPLLDRVAEALPAVFAREPAVLQPIIADCCRIKADVVMRDERESGPRRVLNFGHTVGHALETITRYRRFLHGEAVALGMLCIAELALARGTMAGSDADRLRQLVVQMGPLPPLGDLSASQAMEAIRRDKKTVAGTLHVVLPTGLGAVSIVDDVTEKDLEKAMRKAGMRR